ncbi:hypothetical protein KSP40_PGU003032 [Platanthera guangdongensis]|uniref:PHD and RING finger domain-containing protein 1 n=1 Tax=Platanthera guangdongensis TaxID=2320717 RepID=A0ABR2MU73_9ASPA
MDASSSGIFPNKRQKTLTHKGKEKMEEATTGEKKNCGICLLGAGLKVRGLIDSCDHYFCFICIIEWAKVESRCPMCKQRFRFILRPKVPGLFVSESVFEIPIRNQVYHPSGNESSALSESYDQVSCKICHGTNDDELLLLCDLCDSASHTFCVGLDYTVPEDNWYCHDCVLVREEHAKIDGGADDSDQVRDTSVLDQQQPHTIAEIVADEGSFPSTELLPHQQFDEALSISRTPQARIPEGIFLHAELSESLPSPAPGTLSHLKGVGQQTATLRHSPNMNRRIQEFRKHWNALRSGSLVFSAALDCSVETASGTGEWTSITSSDPSQQSKSTSGDREQPTGSNISRKKPSVTDLQTVNRAWKMMQKAKPRKLATANPSSMASDKGVTSRTNNQFPIKSVLERHKSSGFYQIFKSSNQSKRANRLVVKESRSMNRDLMEFTGIKEVLPTWPSSLVRPPALSLALEIFVKMEKTGVSKYIEGSSSKRFGDLDNNAKSEIQSMVRLNLNRISQGGSLGTERFKEIARISTHSILAACGFEHSKSCARHFSGQVCRHAGPVQQHCASSLMSGSCRECFDSFIKNVVSSILLEKSTSNNSRQ